MLAASCGSELTCSDCSAFNIFQADNLLTVTPSSSDLNDVHNMPGTGLLLGAVEGVQMSAWYVPALGPAPRWCSFLDSITDELDEVGAPGSKGVYEDFKFVERGELERYVVVLSD